MPQPRSTPAPSSGPADLSGLWFDGQFPTLLEHTGSLLRARWVQLPYLCDPGDRGAGLLPTDLNFEATIQGNSVSGQTSTCSTSGLEMAEMELTVSADRNSMTGTWTATHPPRRESMSLRRCLSQQTDQDLEDEDNLRWHDQHLTNVSWYWPASHYMKVMPGGRGIFQGKTWDLSSDAWITQSGGFERIDPKEMQAGDVVVFRGKEGEGEVVGGSFRFDGTKRQNPHPVSHSGIATGRGDQVSQLWWKREIWPRVKSSGSITKFHMADNDRDYGVTRGSIQELAAAFTDQAGDVYYVSPFEVYRPTVSQDFSFLYGGGDCSHWPPQHLVRAPRSGGFLPM